MASPTPFMCMGIFGMRNDKIRGLLVETLEFNGTEYFFKHHDQPISTHCIQLQNIVKASNIRRARKLHIDMTPFLQEYVRISDGTIMFRSTRLESANAQLEKVYTMRINKEMGIAKRKQTVAVNKQVKIVENNQKIKSRFETAEAEFQAERARRIHQLYGGTSHSSGVQAPTNMDE